MQFSILFAFILPLASLVVALPVDELSPSAAEQMLVFGGVHPIDNTTINAHIGLEEEGGLTKRDRCNNNNVAQFTKLSASYLKATLQTTNPWALTNLNWRTYTWWDWGDARVCVYNDYLPVGVSVSRWEAGWAVGYLLTVCCNDQNSDW
jgi:hypothetical protein